MNSRRTAAFAVCRWRTAHEFTSELLPADCADRAFVQDLVYTVVRRYRALRVVLGELMKKWPKGELEALVLVGAAQILYMPDVPDFAAVNETVAAAKASGRDKRLDRVVNGVLRNLLRRRAELEAKLAAAPLAERESYPTALVKRWVARYGEEKAEALAKWHNQPAETYLAYRGGETVLVKDTLDAFDGDVKQWCNTRIASISSSDVKTVKYAHGGETVELEKGTNSTWVLKGLGPKEELDTSKTYSLDSALSYLDFNAVADPKLTEAELGFSTGYVYTVTVKEGTNTVTHVARVGNKVKGGSDRYFKLDDGKWVFAISTYSAENMMKTRKDLVKAKEEPKKAEETKKAEEPKKVEPAKTADTPKKTESAKTADAPKKAEPAQTTAASKKVDSTASAKK